MPSRSDTNLVCSFGALTNTVTGTTTRDPVCPFGVLHITTKTTSVYSASLCPLVPRSNSTHSLMSHKSSELKMHTQKNKLRSHSIQGSSQHSARKVHHGRATTRSRSAPLPTDLQHSNYGNMQQQTCLHIQPSHAQTQSFSTSTQPTGSYTSPEVSDRSRVSFTHSALVQSVSHTARQARGPTPLTGHRKRQHTFGTEARSHSAFTITDSMETREHLPSPYPCSKQHNSASSALDLSERHGQATQHKRTVHTLDVSFDLSLHVVNRASTKLAHRQQTPDSQPAYHIPDSSQHPPDRPYVTGQPHNDRHAGSYSEHHTAYLTTGYLASLTLRTLPSSLDAHFLLQVITVQ